MLWSHHVHGPIFVGFVGNPCPWIYIWWYIQFANKNEDLMKKSDIWFETVDFFWMSKWYRSKMRALHVLAAGVTAIDMYLLYSRNAVLIINKKLERGAFSTKDANRWLLAPPIFVLPSTFSSAPPLLLPLHR